MKNLLFLFIAVALISCKDLDITKVSYSSTTMMGRTVLSVSPDSVVFTFNGRGEPTYYARETKSSEWEGIMKSLAEVDLKKMAELEAPSNKRMTDAAPFGQFLISTKDTTYESAGFDGKNPNEVLMPVMQEMLKIQESIKK
ncbi:MAG: hypothetical protein R2780_01110 [Crocinitomicaceae bacterium]|nr:hypothetical protein [Crocinitomicaceae bacterium]